MLLCSNSFVSFLSTWCKCVFGPFWVLINVPRAMCSSLGLPVTRHRAGSFVSQCCWLNTELGAAGQCCIAPDSYPQPVAVLSHVYPIWFLFICTCILSLFSTTVNIYNERLCNMLQILKTGNAINMKNIQRNSMFLSVKSAWQTHLYKLSSLSFGCLPLMTCAHSSAFLLFPVEKEQHLSLSSLWHIHCVHI